jgi:hypothetical protein
VVIGVSNLKAVVRPGAELHDAGLLFEGEVLDVDLAGRLVDGGRPPLHAARVVQRRLRRQRHLEVAVRAVPHIHSHILNIYLYSFIKFIHSYFLITTQKLNIQILSWPLTSVPSSLRAIGAILGVDPRQIDTI